MSTVDCRGCATSSGPGHTRRTRARRRVDRFRPARVVPGFAVSLAGVCDLTEAARQRLSDGAVIELLGGTPDERPDRYRAACPTLLLPLGVPQLVVHGTDDVHVP